MAMSSWILYASAVAFFLLSGSATAQELCSCSPSTYTFTLDFSLTCPPVSVTRNPAITATFCQISPLGDPNETITDLVPVEVESLGVLELGQEFEVLSQYNITGPFVSGDTFDYTSLIDADGYDGEAVRVIQLNIFATNVLGEQIVNFFAISFTNTCDEYPALIEGDSAGWTKFTTLGTPSVDLCPAAATEPPVEPTDPPIAMSMSMELTIDDIEISLEDALMSMSMNMGSTFRTSKTDKKGKSPKIAKQTSERSPKSPKSPKTKKSKRRRLRVHPIYHAD
mmetsp:Transcript_6032/g.12420  ORF Transcript_6032/g.12420 Transcript_6032/m.12420 type:complete len:281 (+) Transcript_6032:83-925(+)